MGNIVRKTRNLEKLIRKIQKLAKANVESGYFIEQGDHPLAEISYVSLMYKHAMGEGNLPVRNPLPITISLMKGSGFTNQLFSNIKSHLYGTARISTLLDKTGREITEIATSTFGSPFFYTPNSPQWAEAKDGNTPLVDEGFLKDAWSYKTSHNSTPRK